MDGMGWKSLKALILRAPLCGANNMISPMLFVKECNWIRDLVPTRRKLIYLKMKSKYFLNITPISNVLNF